VPFIVAMSIVLPLTVLAGLVGIRIGRYLRDRTNESERAQLYRIEASLLGLLALLLGFSFAMAGARFDLRKQLLLDETNAIGTARLRAGALHDERGYAIQHLLDEYIATRLRGYRARDDAALHAAIDESVRLQREIWTRVSAITNDRPQSLPAALLMQSTNEVIDLHTKRVAAGRNHVPIVVLLMLLVVAVVTMGWLGASVGISERHGTMTTVVLSLLIALVVGVIVDLDEPRAGLIRVSPATLVELQRSLQ
jgi:hypothetical protein